MRAASISVMLGLTLASGAVLAETGGPAGKPVDGGAEALFRAYDADGDGRISRAEVQRSNAGLHAHFSKFDRDADGVLSLEEFRRHESPGSAGS